ncbi:hypothetical protein BJ928_1243 [Rhizobium sp. WW_1]|nr:hypothetical protein BJ928_1243 [Rhizobium sp. WW_1]
MCDFRYAYRLDRFGHRFALHVRHANLTKPYDGLFRHVSLCCRFNVLFRLKPYLKTVHFHRWANLQRRPGFTFECLASS